MALSIASKIIGLFTVGSTAPEPAGFVYVQDAVVDSLDNANLLEVTKSNTEPADKTKLWAASSGDAMTTPAVIKIPVDGAFAAASGANLAKFFCQQGGALKGIYTGNIVFSLYTSASAPTLTIPTAWTTYSYFNCYLAAGIMTWNGDSAVARSSSPTQAATATSAGQAIIVALRET